ncbi:MAG: citrate/2-methylcitrate synthase, partial [Myxococcota bacterium]
AVARTGSTIARGLAGVAASGEAHDDIATTLARGWGITGKADTDRISAALVLCADHELNVSAFTARCVASARGTPYMVVTAALAALQGHRHGGETERFAAMLDEPGAPAAILEARLRRGDHIPGFGHPLYPDGDPRAATLLARRGRGKGGARIEAFIAAGRRLLGAEPTLDLGLVALCRALGLPADAPLALFAVGRLVGWIAHAIEQYASEPTIRPRARYVGPGPVEAEPRGGDLR